MRTLIPSAVLLVASFGLFGVSATGATTWRVDPVHSTAQFTARHFGIVPVVGTIPIKSATVDLEEGRQIPVSMHAELDPANLDTHNSMRDSDLRSDHYFGVATNPNMSFTSTKVTGTDPKDFTIVGNLTIRGQTHEITLKAQCVGQGKTPWGREFIAYTASGTINRSDWGMTYGPVIVGNSVDIALAVEADRI